MTAQENYDFLKNPVTFDVELDYSDAKIGGLPANDYFMLHHSDVKEYERIYKETMFPIFVRNFNNKTPNGYKIIPNSTDAEYKILVKIKRIDTDDGAASADIIIYNINSKEVLVKYSCYGKGDRWESFLSLSKYGFEHLGDDAGKKLAKQIKKINKPQTYY